MATATDTITTAQQQMIELVRQGQDAVVAGLGVWGETVQSLVPDTPSQLTDAMPSRDEVIEATFGFSEKLLAAQRQFVVDVWDAVVPKAASVAKAAPVAPKV